ncbi:MAG: hypothetical protein EON86_03155 [Brevundimonas sp.]|nr:MAG: hypothetical protein EON86_03155 [Brevundimonas sp.]
MPTDRILHYRRVRALPDVGGRTLFCTVTSDGGPHGVLGYPTPERFPDFAGEAAWFRVRWFRKGRFEVITQVADRSGAPLAGAIV